MPQPTIPPRTSSKRTFTQLQQDHSSLVSLRDSLKVDLHETRKRMKMAIGAMETPYWNSAKNASEIELRRTETISELERYDFLNRGGTDDDWDSSPRKSELEVKARSLAHKVIAFGKQAARLDYAGLRDEKLASRRAFVSMFLSSKLGLGIRASAPTRESTVQSNFREALIERYDLRGQGSRDQMLWDVILGDWIHKSQMTASHIFAYRHGSAAMSAIFGVDVSDELFSPCNGLMLSTVLESEFESGFYAIVPDLPANATDQQREDWLKQVPREYKLRFIDKPRADWVPGKKLTEADTHRYNKIFQGTQTWGSLDGRKLVFRNNNRPRARYLYFNFILNMLTFAWRYQEKAAEIVDSEYGEKIWGSPGPYVKRSMVRAFVEEVGHDIEPYLRDTVTEDENRKYTAGDDELLQEAITSQMIMKADEDEEEDDDDEWEEDEEGMVE